MTKKEEKVLWLCFFVFYFTIFSEPHHPLLSFLFQVANFASTEDDGSFWSRWIKPEDIAQAEV